MTFSSRGRVIGMTKNSLGILLAIFSTITFSSGSGIVRHLSKDLHPFEIAFFSAFFGLLAMSPWILRNGVHTLRTEKFGLHLIRVITGVVGILGIFYALSITPLATVTALNLTMPIFTTLLAVIYLKDQVMPAKWVAIFLGFVGVFIIVRPGFVEIDIGSLLVLAGSFLFAITILAMKILTRTDSVMNITIYGVLLRAPLLLVPAVFVWQWPNLNQLIWLAIMGSVGALSSFTFAQALRLVDTSVVTPLFFLQLIWAATIGYIFFAEIPSLYTWLGGLLIFVSVTYMAYRDSKTYQ